MIRFYLRAVLAAFTLILALVALDRVLPPPRDAHAQNYNQDTPSAPFVSFTPEQLRRFWSNQALLNGVTTDAGWNTAMQTIFSAANWPGVNATSLAFLRSFFVQGVHVGVP